MLFANGTVRCAAAALAQVAAIIDAATASGTLAVVRFGQRRLIVSPFEPGNAER
jgi:hypothetical protein